MKRILDFSETDLIIKELDKNGFGRVYNVLPAGYESYLKILMPICIDRNIPLVEYPFNAISVEEINKKVKFWDEYGIVNGWPSPNNLEKTTYRELCVYYNIPFNKFIDTQSIWNINKEWPPNIGSSNQEDLKTIRTFINVIGANNKTYFFGDVLDGKGLQEEGTLVDWLFYGDLSELENIFIERDSDFPSYFFAETKEWCFFHPEDESFLLLGCSKTLSKHMMELNNVECFEVNVNEQIIKV